MEHSIYVLLGSISDDSFFFLLNVFWTIFEHHYLFSASVAARFHITKYPTLKVIRNGQPTKREYRGQRSAEAFVDFVKKQLEDPIKEFYNLKDLTELDDKKRMIIGYFDRKDVPEYQMFRRVATNLKDDCQFHVGFG